MPFFDDSRLDDRRALEASDQVLRRLAQAGARVRTEAAQSADPLAVVAELPRPRAVIAVGSEARLIRAILEPTCPVPFVAWSRHGLPGWVGALDLVLVLATDGNDPTLIATTREAQRRGSQLIIACPQPSSIAEYVTGRDSILLPTTTSDTLAAAVVVLAALHRMQLGPAVNTDALADTFDGVAEECSPYVDLSENPAKDLALGLAEAQPLVWGGSVLAGRASRRIAEALRAASGRAALAADGQALMPVLGAVPPKDPFADPFEAGESDRRPTLVILDDGNSDQVTLAEQNRLREMADAADVRVCPIQHNSGGDLDRYVGLLQVGLYGAVYLAVGLGQPTGSD